MLKNKEWGKITNIVIPTEKETISISFENETVTLSQDCYCVFDSKDSGTMAASSVLMLSVGDFVFELFEV